jgi:hypothetical protein
MKKIGFLVFIAAIVIGVVFASFTSFGKAESSFFKINFNRGVAGSGNVAAEKRDVGDFKSIDVSGVFEVQIVAQKDFSVEVEADDNLLPLIRTEVEDGVLQIETEKRISSPTRLFVKISAPNIEKLEVSGVAKVNVAELKNSALTLDTSGASKITLAGETAKLLIDVSGASKIDAENLKAENAEVETSGASSVNVFVTNYLRADASGASKVTYSGSPANVERKTSGASKVAAK